MGRADITETADGGFMCIMRKPSSLPPKDGDKVKADEKIVDAGKGFRRMKKATRRVLAVSKDELERREAAWKDSRPKLLQPK